MIEHTGNHIMGNFFIQSMVDQWWFLLMIAIAAIILFFSRNRPTIVFSWIAMMLFVFAIITNAIEMKMMYEIEKVYNKLDCKQVTSE